MSNKLHKVKDSRQSAGMEITGQVIEYILATTAAAVCVAVPLYARDGYHEIGNAKFDIYKNILYMGLPVLLILAVVYAGCKLREKQMWRLSVTDGFVLAYLFLTILSTILGGFCKDALWGAYGWNMGLFAQISFVLLYLFFSRFGKYYQPVLLILCSVSAVVFLIGILHRVGIDPIGFYNGLTDGQMAQFLSTMGQATWYASYLVVVLPVGIAVFLYTRGRAWRIVSGIYTTVGFCSLVTQNSDSAYFALTGFILVFFWTCVKERETLRRFTAVCILFLASGKLMYFLMKIDPNPELKYDFITQLVLCSPVTWVLLILSLALYVVLRLRRDRAYPADKMLRVRKAVLAGAGAVLVGMIVLIILQTGGFLPDRLAESLSEVPYFNWNNDWGNGRGLIWSFAVKVFTEEDLPHKLIGAGPDCLSSYMAAYYSEEAELYWGQKVLTNAHNEWLNILLNGGLLGAASYIGIFVTAIRRFLKAAGKGLLLTGIAAAAVSYMAYNFFCYQQVCCTPFMFILMGVGEYIKSKNDCM